jgi:hypothetical protein
MPLIASRAGGSASGFGGLRTFGAASAVDTGSMFPIGAVTVGSAGASSVTFSSIPSTYKHLQIRAMTRDNGAGVYNTYLVTYNSDTGANYSHHAMYGQNVSTVDQFGGASQNAMAVYATPGAVAAGIFGVQIIDILDYANTNKYKTQRSLGGVNENNDTNLLALMSGSWRSTSAISSITITANSATFQQYSQFALYGIKGA